MKKSVLLSIALALSIGSAGAQTAKPSAPVTAASPVEAPSTEQAPPQYDPATVARSMGMAMGVLPVVQKACGHSGAEQSKLRQRLDAFESSISTQLTKDLMQHYRTGAMAADGLMTNELANMTKERKASLCKEFDAQYPKMMSQLDLAAKKRGPEPAAKDKKQP